MTPRAQIAVVFTSRRTSSHDDEYAAMASCMEELVHGHPGFVDMVSVRDPVTRIGVTVAYFEDEESVIGWKANLDHAEAQRRGIADFYESYEVTVARIVRQYGHSTKEAP
jgi:heme-degrading monooxygenase HmoA